MNDIAGLEVEETKEEKVKDFQKEKEKRVPFHTWEVGGEEHKMKLTTAMIGKLENKYRCNVTELIFTDGMPMLSVLITVAQAAISPWEHGTSYEKVMGYFDEYVAEGGSQQEFLKDVIVPTMAVSGFFTKKAEAELMDHMIELD